jgi:hypothetical protein
MTFTNPPLAGTIRLLFPARWKKEKSRNRHAARPSAKMRRGQDDQQQARSA